MKTPLIIGIAGGSGSGKTTVVKNIIKNIETKNVLRIEQDSYYKSQDHIPFEERVKQDYDHPFSFDHELLVKHLDDLILGKSIQAPVYDFKIHTRKNEYEIIEPKDIIIIDGIFVLYDPEIRKRLDIKVFVDTDPDVRLIRRIIRDIKERDRSLDSIILQYMSTVRPNHYNFIEPSKAYADIIIPDGGENQVAINILSETIRSRLKND